MGNEILDTIGQRYAEGSIKNQHLESVIFNEVYNSDKERVNDACNDAARIRAARLEAETGVSLASIRDTRIDTGALAGDSTVLAGIEMKIGAAQIPMGYAGPVRINGEYVRGEDIYIPLATNEAALVAGVQRGIKAINLSGGITTRVKYDGMSRAPLIEAPSIEEANTFLRKIGKEHDALVREWGKYVRDPFVRLEKIDPYLLGTKLFLRMTFKTGDAMGMNGVTKASADICKQLLTSLPDWRLVTISGNMCTDKKAAHINVLNGRGKSVDTEVFIPTEVLTSVFKAGTTPRQVEKVVFHKCYLGSTLSGTISGFNVNAANTIAAFFAAAGQDLAQVITSASCYVQAEAVEGGLHFTVSLPSLEIATFGGGTRFGTAREALALMGCDTPGRSIDENTSVMRLAEIAATAVTALDLNTACAQAAGYEMANSHVRLARGESE